jgi:hypothetical protein
MLIAFYSGHITDKELPSYRGPALKFCSYVLDVASTSGDCTRSIWLESLSVASSSALITASRIDSQFLS